MSQTQNDGTTSQNKFKFPPPGAQSCSPQSLRSPHAHALTVEEPGDIGGGRSLGLAGNRRIFPVESGHVSRGVDQHGRRGCEMRKGAELEACNNVRLNRAIAIALLH